MGKVELSGPPPSGFTWPNTNTDASGNFSLATVAGSHNLRVSVGSAPAPDGSGGRYGFILWYNLTLSQDTALALTIPTAKVTVHVQDPMGKPVAGANVGASQYADSITVATGPLTMRTNGPNPQSTGSLDASGTTNAAGDATLWAVIGTVASPTSGDTISLGVDPPSGSNLKFTRITLPSVTPNATQVIALQYVHSVPITTASISPSATSPGVYSDPATVTLSANAASGFTIASTSYRVDSTSGSYLPYTAPFQVSGNGPHTIMFCSVDNVGLLEASKTLSLTIASDMTAPTTTVSLSGTAGNAPWYRSAVTVTLSATDNAGGSGVAATYYTVDTGAQQTYSAPFPVSADGVHTVAFWSVDKANNAEQHQQQSISIDTIPPTGVTVTPERAPDSNGWYNHPVKVTFSGTDATSGIASCTSTTYSGPDSATASVTGTCTDNAGNVSAAVPYAFKYDATKPTVTYTGNAGTYTADQTVSIICTAADATSGVASTTCQNVTGPAYSFIVGANPYSATATDKAGNSDTGATTFTVTASAGSVSNVVSQFVSNQGQANSLITKLQKGNIDAFINEVNAQTGKALTQAQAQTLIKLANALR